MQKEQSDALALRLLLSAEARSSSSTSTQPASPLSGAMCTPVERLIVIATILYFVALIFGLAASHSGTPTGRRGIALLLLVRAASAGTCG